jgi:hypothetical protein
LSKEELVTIEAADIRASRVFSEPSAPNLAEEEA